MMALRRSLAVWLQGVRLVSVSRRPRERAPNESGYAYLMALFLVLALVISSTIAVQSATTTAKREREDDMIWRGSQYVRAIRLYYKKTGKYPQTLDDLEKGQPQLHFLRAAAYKDPMNRADGTWRFIYVNGSGQIIGSVKYATLQQMAFLDLQGAQVGQGTAAQANPFAGMGVSAASLASQSSANATTATAQPGANGTSPQTGAQAGSQPGSQNASTAQPGVNPLTLLKPTGPVNGPVLGGFLTGVGGSVDSASLKVYRGAKKYKDFEFIWNPLEDQAVAMAQGLNPQGQTGVAGQPGMPIGLGAAGTSTAAGASTGTSFGAAPAAGTAGAPGAPPAPQQPQQ